MVQGLCECWLVLGCTESAGAYLEGVECVRWDAERPVVETYTGDRALIHR